MEQPTDQFQKMRKIFLTQIPVHQLVLEIQFSCF